MSEAEEREVLLRVLVGSHAHGLARPDSDRDYREVFIIPTSEMLSLGRPPLKYAWMTSSKWTDDEDGTEIAQFLNLVAKGSTHHIEMLFAGCDMLWLGGAGDVAGRVRMAQDVVSIGQLLISRKPFIEGAVGYAMNSFRKIDTDHAKWRVGMLRVLHQAYELVETGTLANGLLVPDEGWGYTIRRAGTDQMTDGEAYDIAKTFEDMIRHAALVSPLPEQPDWTTANQWLLQLRQDRW